MKLNSNTCKKKNSPIDIKMCSFDINIHDSALEKKGIRIITAKRAKYFRKIHLALPEASTKDSVFLNENWVLR